MRSSLPFLAAAAASQCNQKAGGTCLTGLCDAALGPTTCVVGLCVCGPGTCADENGVCRPSIVNWCNTDTGGTCSHAACENYRGPASCYNGKCVCDKGHCADSAGVCQPEGAGVAEVWSNVLDSSASDFKCSKMTGGTCFGGRCDAGRGPSTCLFGVCRCQSATCSDDQGICHSVFVPGTNDIQTGGTCYAANCSTFRGPTKCNEHRCECKEGYYTDLSGVCQPVGTPLYGMDGQTPTASTITEASFAAGGRALVLLPPAAEACGAMYGLVLPGMVVAMVAVNAVLWRGEASRRSARAFSADLFKQAAAFSLVVLFNTYAADRFADTMGGSACSWFAAAVAAFATVGLAAAAVLGRAARGLVRSAPGPAVPTAVAAQAVAWCLVVGAGLAASTMALVVQVDAVQPAVTNMSGMAVVLLPAAAMAAVAAVSDRTLKAESRGRVAASEPLLGQ